MTALQESTCTGRSSEKLATCRLGCCGMEQSVRVNWIWECFAISKEKFRVLEIKITPSLVPSKGPCSLYYRSRSAHDTVHVSITSFREKRNCGTLLTLQTLHHQMFTVVLKERFFHNAMPKNLQDLRENITPHYHMTSVGRMFGNPKRPLEVCLQVYCCVVKCIEVIKYLLFLFRPLYKTVLNLKTNRLFNLFSPNKSYTFYDLLFLPLSHP
jgi:hypothetical protein